MRALLIFPTLAAAGAPPDRACFEKLGPACGPDERKGEAECKACEAKNAADLKAAGCTDEELAEFCAPRPTRPPQPPGPRECERELFENCGRDRNNTADCKACETKNADALKKAGCTDDELGRFCPTYDDARQAFIDEINSKQSLWTAGHNPRFRGQPIGASKPLLGVLAGEEERIAALIKSGEMEVVEHSRAIPSDFQSETAFPKCAKTIGDIRDQSNCGCCWAFAAAEAASDRLCIQTNGSNLVPLSAEDMCFCSNSNGCGGGSPSSAWNYVKSHGLVTGAQQQPDDGKTDPFKGGGYCSSFSLPHCHHHGPMGSDPYPAEGAKGCPSQRSAKCPTKCDSDAKAPHNVFASDKYKVSGTASFRNADAMAQAIVDHGPISVSFTVYADFENYAGGIYKHTSGSSLGGHAVKAVGFGTDNGQKYWKIANSWNPYWGEKGYFRMVRGENNCGIEGGAVASSADAKWTVPH